VLIRDPNLFLSADRKKLRYGTKEKAEDEKWVTFAVARK